MFVLHSLTPKMAFQSKLRLILSFGKTCMEILGGKLVAMNEKNLNNNISSENQN